MAAHREAKKSDPKRIFNRYSDEAILSGDRAVGNYVEWMVSEYATVYCYLILLWVLAICPEHTAATELPLNRARSSLSFGSAYLLLGATSSS